MNKKILSIFALIMALSFAVSCSNSDTTGTGGNNNNTNKDFATFTASGDKGDPTAEATAIEMVVGDAQTTSGEKTANITLTATKADGDTGSAAITYAITGFENVTSTLSDQSTNEETLSGITQSTITLENPYNQLKIADSIDLGAALSANGKYDMVKLTITAKCEGYNDKKIDVYVKLVHTAS